MQVNILHSHVYIMYLYMTIMQIMSTASYIYSGIGVSYPEAVLHADPRVQQHACYNTMVNSI